MRIMKLQPSPVKKQSKVSQVRDEGPVQLNRSELLELEKGMNRWELKWQETEAKRKENLKRAQKAETGWLREKKVMELALKKAQDDLQELEDAVGSIFSPKQLSYLKKCKENGKARVIWDPADLASALTLLSMSPKMYDFLRRRRGLPLPSPTTVRRYMAQFPVEPGLQQSVFSTLKSHGAKKSPRQRTVILAFDEIMIRKRIEYDIARDRIIGPYTYVQVVIARGLFDNWREPVFYAFTPMTKELLNTIIGEFKKCDFNVVACVSDLGPGNQKLLRELNITKEHPYFKSTHVDNKIYFFADAPHLLKLIRNHFLDDGFKLQPLADDPKDRHEVRKQHLFRLLDPDVLPHVAHHGLTNHHLTVKYMERQRVHLAKEVFSEAVVTALIGAERGKKMKPSETMSTRTFITVVNHWFRLFNTATDRRKSEAAKKQGVKIPSADLPFGAALEDQENILTETTFLFETCRMINKENRKLAPFQEGILINCSALRMLHQDLQAQFPTEDVSIFTTRLNSDTVERFFSQMRGARSNNPNPTATDFKYRFRSYLLGNNPDETILGLDTNVAVGENDPVSMRTQAAKDVVHSVEEGFVDVGGQSVDVSQESPETVIETETELAEAVRRWDESFENEDNRLWSKASVVQILPGLVEEEDEDKEEEEDEGEGIDALCHSDVIVLQEDLPGGVFVQLAEDGLEVRELLDELKVGGVLHLAGVVAYNLANKGLKFYEEKNLQSEPADWWITAYAQQGYLPPSKALAEACNELEGFFKKYNGKGVRGKQSTLGKMTVAAKEELPDIDEKIVKEYLTVRLRFRLRYINMNKTWKSWPKKAGKAQPQNPRKRNRMPKVQGEDPSQRVSKRLRYGNT